MNRVLLYLKLQAQITLFGATFPQINGALIITKPLLFLMFIWHFTSCLWSWLDLFNDRDAHSWYNTLDLYSIGLKYKYMFSLLFTMNIATTTGYPEMIVYNNYERALYILFIYFGVALFALSFGLFSANTKALPEKYEHVFEELRKMQSLIELGSIKPGLRNKIENYYSYIVDKKGRNKTCLEALDGLMPVTTVIYSNVF